MLASCKDVDWREQVEAKPQVRQSCYIGVLYQYQCDPWMDTMH